MIMVTEDLEPKKERKRERERERERESEREGDRESLTVKWIHTAVSFFTTTNESFFTTRIYADRIHP